MPLVRDGGRGRRHVPEGSPTWQREAGYSRLTARRGSGRMSGVPRSVLRLWRLQMAKTLIVVGLALIGVAILLQLVTAVLAVAVPLGVLLVIIGGIWLVLSSRRSAD